MEPPGSPREDRSPVEIPRAELRCGFVAPVIEDHRSTNSLPPVAVDRGDIRTVDTVVLEEPVERLHTHRFHALRRQVADGIFHHRGGNCRVHAEAVGKVCGHVVFTAAHVDLAFSRLAEGDDPGIKPVYQRSQGDQIESPPGTDVEHIVHLFFLSDSR